MTSDCLKIAVFTYAVDKDNQAISFHDFDAFSRGNIDNCSTIPCALNYFSKIKLTKALPSFL